VEQPLQPLHFREQQRVWLRQITILLSEWNGSMDSVNGHRHRLGGRRNIPLSLNNNGVNSTKIEKECI
jgi:hypothetical protein